MAHTPPTTLEPRVRFWHPNTHEHLWTSACDPAELVEETRQALAELVEAGVWVPVTIDLVPVGTADTNNAWPQRWVGRLRLNEDGELELTPAAELLEAILVTPNPFIDEEPAAK